VFSTTQNLPPVSKSLYKSTLDFLILQSPIEPKGNHLRRLNTFAAMVCSCIKTKKSSLEGISRPEGASSKQSESHISQAKRWVSSKWTDWETFFAPYAGKLLAKIAAKGELVLVIDGSETAADCVTLMLSVVWRGYAIPLAWITRKGKKGHFSEDVHLELLVMGKKIMTLTDSGELVLFKADPGGYEEISRVQVGAKNWCNPAYADGKLYFRDTKVLRCVKLR